MLGMVVFPDKSITSLNSKFLPPLRDFHRISLYSWGAASLVHLYRSLWATHTTFCLGVGAYAVPSAYFPRSVRRCCCFTCVTVESLAPTYKIYTEAYCAF
ncbi:hypothetical protein Ahy_A07g034930 [Arachis hypogaea]|uniref:Aminotransferase-like plant mobile domain-containing protein n=1 Tax=Arachis hypogaea TaxID=3818 RepID=A0A445CDC6_ARAHY|nr:hypothetical protein Ahy_A07g034930 [Arachis hypogaea]